MKRISAVVVLAIALGLTLSACGDASEPSTPAPTSIDRKTGGKSG